MRFRISAAVLNYVVNAEGLTQRAEVAASGSDFGALDEAAVFRIAAEDGEEKRFAFELHVRAVEFRIEIYVTILKRAEGKSVSPDVAEMADTETERGESRFEITFVDAILFEQRVAILVLGGRPEVEEAAAEAQIAAEDIQLQAIFEEGALDRIIGKTEIGAACIDFPAVVVAEEIGAFDGDGSRLFSAGSADDQADPEDEGGKALTHPYPPAGCRADG